MYDAELVEVVPTVDLTAPVLNTATVDGTSLVLNYTEANGLDVASLPVGTDFTIGTDGVAQTVNAVVGVTGTDVTLTLTPGVAESDTVTVSYTAGPVGARIQDEATNPAANLVGQAVTNRTDTTAPVLNTATVDGTSLVLNYTEANGLDVASLPVGTDFTIGTDGVAQTVTGVLVNPTNVTLTLTPGVAPGDMVTVSYTAGPVGARIQDEATNPAANLVAQGVTNNTVDLTAPVLNTATVDGTSLVLNYTEANGLDVASLPVGTDFTIGTDGVAQTVNAVVGVTGTDVTLTLTPGVAESDTVTVSYTAGPVGARIQDEATNPAANLVGQAVTNRTDTTAPVLNTATVDGTSLVLNYTEVNGLDVASLPVGTDFTIGTDGVAQTVNAVVGVTGTDVTLTLTPGVAPGDMVTVSYTAGPVGARIQDEATNPAANLVAQGVTNNTVAVPVAAWTAVAQNPAGSWQNSSFDNRTFRTLLKGSAITASGAPVYVTLRGRTTGSYTVENLSLVPRDGTTLNGVGPLQPVTFSGVSSVTVNANQTVTSDPVAFSLAPGQDVFLTFWAPPAGGIGGVYRDGGAETAAWYINGTDQSGVVDWTPLVISGTKAHVYDAELVEVSPTPDMTAPVLNTATVDGTSLVLTYNEPLDVASLPVGTDFTIGTDGVAQTVNAVVGVTGTDVTLTLTPGVAEGDMVTVSYTAGPVGARIQDGATNPAANLVGQAVTNNTVVVPVAAWTAVAQNPAGSWQNSNFDNRTFRMLLKGSAITASGAPVYVTLRGRTTGSYTLENLSLVPRDGTTLNGVGLLQPVTFSGASSVTVNANQTVTSDPVAFSLAPGQDVFLTFWVPDGSAGVYRDGGTETAAWYITGTDQSGVVDWTPLVISGTRAHVYDAELVEVVPTVDLTAPVLNTATVDGTSLVLNYTEANGLDVASLPVGTDFTIGTDGVAQTVNAVVGVTGTDVTLTLTPGVAESDTVTVSYTAGPVGARIQDEATNPAANLVGQAVTNRTDTTAPVLNTATVDGTSLVLNYTEANGLDETSTPATGAFTIGTDGVAQTVTGVLVNPTNVTLTLDPGVAQGDAVTVEYLAAGAGGNPIQDVAGNDAVDLTPPIAVTNNTPGD